MRNPESVVTDKLTKVIPTHVFQQKHSERFTVGIADLELIYEGMTIWMEIKAPPLPKRSDTLMKLMGEETHQLKATQEMHLKKRTEHGQGGYVLYGTKTHVAFWEVWEVPEFITKASFLERTVLYKDWWSYFIRYLPRGVV